MRSKSNTRVIIMSLSDFTVNYIIKNASKYFTFLIHKMGIIIIAPKSYMVVMSIKFVNISKMLTVVLTHGEYYVFIK